MNTVELYRRVVSEAPGKEAAEEQKKQPLDQTQKLEFVTKYKMPNVKCLDMVSLSIKP